MILYFIMKLLRITTSKIKQKNQTLFQCYCLLDLYICIVSTAMVFSLASSLLKSCLLDCSWLSACFCYSVGIDTFYFNSCRFQFHRQVFNFVLGISAMGTSASELKDEVFDGYFAGCQRMMRVSGLPCSLLSI